MATYNEAVGCRVYVDPVQVTGAATLLVLVRTKTGLYHELRISGVDVNRAICLRRTANKMCAKFKDLAAGLCHSL